MEKEAFAEWKKELRVYKKVLTLTDRDLTMHPGFCSVWEFELEYPFNSASARVLFECYAQTTGCLFYEVSTRYFWFARDHWAPRIALIKQAVSILESRIQDA